MFLIRAGLSRRQLGGAEICARVYRPRRALESPLFRMVEQHLEEFLRVTRSPSPRRTARFVPSSSACCAGSSHVASYAFLLSRMDGTPGFPTPLGVLRAVEAPRYEVAMNEQIDAVIAKRGRGDLGQAPGSRRHLGSEVTVSS